MQEDIEIYVKKATVEEVAGWLERVFTIVEKQASSNRKTHRFNVEFNALSLPITVVERAAKTDFTSIWFDSSESPWPSDRECALAAFAFFNKPVRCNPEFWQEGDDADLWLEISADGEATLSWRTEDWICTQRIRA